jgi:4-carboxymuconolactone decarboxylase
MRVFASLAAACAVSAPVAAPAEDRGSSVASAAPRVAPPVVRAVAPALADYTDAVLFGEVWERPDLSKRDRSFVVVAALVAGGHTDQMAGHFGRALDNGVTPQELSGVITHLAFYAGWPRAMSAVGVANTVLAERGLSPVSTLDELAPLDAAADAPRAASVQASVGPLAPALADYTNGVLFDDLWRRTDLTPRDRSLATVVALTANGQAEQLPFHLNRAMDNGLTRTQVGEVLTHLAFYAGWPRAMSAVAVADTVFKSREPAAE